MRTKSTRPFLALCCAIAAGMLFFLGSASSAQAGFFDYLASAGNSTLLSNAGLLIPGLVGMAILISSRRLLRRRSAEPESLPRI